MINLLNIAIKAAIESSREVLKIYEQGFTVSLKEDESPVTTGDLKANEIITSYILPTDIPILSEESEKDTLEKRKNWKRYWCIDPIDGTKEYVNKTDEYCISIGLLTNETSLLGVLAAPSMNIFYFAAEGIGSFKWKGVYEDLYSLLDSENIVEEIMKNSIQLPVKPALNPYIFLTSRSHFSNLDQEYFQKLEREHEEVQMIQMGSAIKIGWVVEGKANEYARLSPVNFWDIAGGHAIAKYAGLKIIDIASQKEVTYNDIETLKISGYIIKNI
ncbi:3'(2'),5'-bisphosphate nucleotidase CysQ family protein [Apibacter adventoris]|uniref:3'(2'),5-bisphosphonucleoside 3'(2')-phosphohydrolase n=1 Tax=Apibacter adventoris TaxID=1679466 RepID=A0A2S8AG62_9FLAO|nr:3'(2'),5'-bisphosphate nucleotidase CysQ [Apibacter adventoris]PQL95288.1 3'(2'),5'-bisphosphate nucleotidase CysQ [Apibacter adventoris]